MAETTSDNVDSRVADLENDLQILSLAFVALRRAVRSVMNHHGVYTNPGSTDDELLDFLTDLAGKGDEVERLRALLTDIYQEGDSANGAIGPGIMGRVRDALGER